MKITVANAVKALLAVKFQNAGKWEKDGEVKKIQDKINVLAEVVDDALLKDIKDKETKKLVTSICKALEAGDSVEVEKPAKAKKGAKAEVAVATKGKKGAKAKAEVEEEEEDDEDEDEEES